MSQTQLLGRPVWCELLTSDVKAAEAFYTHVVGWTVAPFGPGYDIIKRPGDGRGIGGGRAVSGMAADRRGSLVIVDEYQDCVAEQHAVDLVAHRPGGAQRDFRTDPGRLAGGDGEHATAGARRLRHAAH